MRLIHVVSGNVMGGAQRYALDICRHYAGAGDDVIVLTRDAKGVDCHFEKTGVRMVHAPLRDYPDFFSSIILRPLLEEGPKGATIVHVHRYRDALTAIAARRLARRPDVRIVVTRHISERGKNNWLRRFIYRHVDAHICVSRFARREFLAAWPSGRYPFDTARLHVIFNSRNVEPERPGLPEKGPVTAMYHGTLRAGKGLETLIEAMALLKDTKLRLKIVGVGEPDFCDTLRRKALALGVMEKIDWVRNAVDPLSLMGSCHFGVLPSETPEAFGMANLEYMAAGRAQVCTFNGAQPEYMTSSVEAIRVEPGDSVGLAEAMRKLYEDRELCEKMGAKAAATYDEKLAWPHFVGRLGRIYSTLNEMK